MRLLFQRDAAQAEKMFQSFVSYMKDRGFDLKVFDKKQIKKSFGYGLYGTWKKTLGELHYRKLIMVFCEKDARVSWPSNNYPDYLMVNMARAPNKEALLGAEKELMGLLELDREFS